MKRKVESMNNAYSKLGKKYKEAISQMQAMMTVKEHEIQVNISYD